MLRDCILKSLVLCCCLGSALTAFCAPTFTNPYRIPTNNDPALIAAGDLNGDGVPDFVWAGPKSPGSSVGVFLSQPGGGWQAGTSLPFPSGIGIGSCALVDVNRDKNLDLVCSGEYTFTAYMVVYPGNGDGTFQSPITTTIYNSNGNYVDVGLGNEGDLNGDGIPDFYFEDALNNVVFILLSDGNGGFKPPIAKPFGSNGGGIINQVIPFAADVNGDGIPDLLFPQGPEVALGNGDGTFRAIANYEQTAYYLSTCIFRDMDGDGHLDAVCGYAETTTGDITGATDLMILHGNPDGSFNTTPISQTRFGDYNNEFDGFGTFQAPLYVADVNGDGTLDVVGYSGDGLAVSLGSAGLKFAKPLHYAAGLITPYIYGVGSMNQGFAIDVNGDGILDFVSTGPNGIYISYGNQDGSYRTAFAPEVTELIGDPTVADFNGDGIPDIAATGDSAIKLSVGKGDGTFAPPVALSNNNGAVNFSTPLSATNAHILHGDFNGDGKLDLLAIGSSSIYVYQSYILFGNGDGTFQAPLLVPNSASLFPLYESLIDQAVYDVNHDGKSDLLSYDVIDNPTYPISSTSEIVFSLSNGDGTFKEVMSPVPEDSDANGFGHMILPSLADFDGDGKLDAAYGSLKNVYVVKGKGDGTFASTGVALPIPSIAGQAPVSSLSISAADIDGDGKQDIAVLVQYGAGQYPFPSPLATAVVVFFGNGDGTFSAPVVADQFDRNYTDLFTAHLDTSGRSQIILKTSGSLGGGYAVGVIDSLPGRTFGPEVNYFAGTGLSGFAVADLNKDGVPDMVFGNGDYNIRASSVTVLLGQGDTPDVTGTLVAVPEPSIVGQTFNLVATLTPPTAGALSGNVSFTVDGNNVGTAPLANNAATLPVTAALAIGTHAIGATWPGTSTYAAVTLTGTHQVVALPTTTALVSSLNPATIGQNVTFTATVASSLGVPTGSGVFTDGATALGTANLVNGVAVLSTRSLSVGSHAITATYAPTASFQGSNASLTEVINGAASVTTLTSSVNPAYALQPVTLNAQVTSSFSGVPTGTITFMDGATTLGSAAVATNGTASVTVNFPTPGSHALKAVYSGDASFNSSTSNVLSETVLINISETMLVFLPSSAGAFVPVTLNASVISTTAIQFAPGAVPSGTVTFYDGATVLGTAILNAKGFASITVSTFQAGTHTLTATYGGNVSFGSSTSPQYSLLVTPDATVTTITGAPNPAALGAAVTFNMTVSSAVTPAVPTGKVTVYDGTNTLGQAGRDSQGHASFTTSALAIGTHSITASYSGDPNFTASGSGAFQETITPFLGDFTFTVAPSSMTFYTGQAGNATATAAAQGGFNYPLALSCSGLPANATCQFQPDTIAGGAGTAGLVVQTSAPHAVASLEPSLLQRWRRSGAAGALACLVLFFLPRRQRRRFLMLLLLAWAATTFSACGGVGTLAGGTPPGIYTITVTAQASNAGQQLAHSYPITLTVKSLF